MEFEKNNPAVGSGIREDSKPRSLQWIVEADGLLASGQPQVAFQKIKALLQQEPENAHGLRILGKIFAACGRMEDADAAYRASIEVDPSITATWLGLGLLCRDRRQTGEARFCFERAVTLSPLDPFLQTNLAVVLGDSGRLAESIERLEEALRLHPGAMTARSNLLLTLHYDPSGTPERPSPPSGPLRIGFLSGDFRTHPVGRLMSALWGHWSPADVVIHAYETGGPSDSLTSKLKEHASCWRSLVGLDDEVAARQVAVDALDVLIDLSGHTSGHRLGVLNHQPAAVQMTWFGYPNTTGLQSVDYRLTDEEADPPGIEDRYSERLIRLPRVAWVYQPTSESIPVLPRPSARGERFTWGCLNNPAKVHAGCLAVWGRILSAVSESRLLLLVRDDADSRERIRAGLLAAGAAPEQLVFVPPGSSHQYCEYHHQVDVMLDPFPYNGAVTTADALWMGVPVLGIRGDSYHSRQGWMIARAMGLEEWVCSSADSLVETAVAVSQKPEAVQTLSASLRPRLQASPLMDHAGFAARLLSVLRGVTAQPWVFKKS
jgi:tetratricopeptide (TPR) repeat protein